MAKQLEDFSKKYSGVVVACSAGIDSTALFHLIYKIIKEKNIKISLAICHLNFGLRQIDSDLDQNFLSQLAKDHQVPFFCQTWHKLDKARPRESTQMWARRLRYDFFAQLIKEGWLIALAHHMDDLAENILLRLARGVSPFAFSGMSEFHGHCWRPFLSQSKQSISAWATRQNIQHREDASNAMLKYNRNLLRLRVIPLLKQINHQVSKHFATFSSDLNDLLIFADQATDRLLAQHMQDARLMLEVFRGNRRGVQKAILVKYLKENGCSEQNLSSTLLENILSIIEKKDHENFELKKRNNQQILNLADGYDLFISNSYIKVKTRQKYQTTMNRKYSRSLFEQFELHCLIPQNASLICSDLNKDRSAVCIKNQQEKTVQISISKPASRSKIKLKGKPFRQPVKEIWRQWQISKNDRKDWLIIDEKSMDTCQTVLMHNNCLYTDNRGSPQETELGTIYTSSLFQL